MFLVFIFFGAEKGSDCDHLLTLGERTWLRELAC
jgi:hypothetical protein